ncbi:MAG: hypothetical protein ACJ74Z_02440 [Bryobacteraceae bacterium]
MLPAVEDRIKACVLIVPSFNLQTPLPEVDELNFAPGGEGPVLMLNGTFDFFYPPESSQLPMLRLLGTRSMDRRCVHFDVYRFRANSGCR